MPEKGREVTILMWVININLSDHNCRLSVITALQLTGRVMYKTWC